MIYRHADGWYTLSSIDPEGPSYDLSPAEGREWLRKRKFPKRIVESREVGFIYTSRTLEAL